MGAVGSLPALTRLYLGAKHAVCTWLGLRVWPGAHEGWPALAPLVTKAGHGPPPGREHQELFTGWVLGAWGRGMAGTWRWSAGQIPGCGWALGAEWGQGPGRRRQGANSLWGEGAGRKSCWVVQVGLVCMWHSHLWGGASGLRCQKSSRSRPGIILSPPGIVLSPPPSFGPSLISWEVDAQALLVHEAEDMEAQQEI